MIMYQHERDERRTESRGARPRPRLPLPVPALFPAQDRYLQRRRLDPVLARMNGWYPSDRAGDRVARIVIPCSPADRGFWQARAMMPGIEKRYQSPFSDRGNSVVVVFPARGMARRLVVIEGPMDALAAASLGYVGIALMGNTPPSSCFDYIAEQWPGASVLVVPDADARSTGAEWALQLTARDLDARMALVAGTKDLASLSPEERREVLS